MHSPLLTSLVILFLLSILVTTFCAKLRLPAIVGFLLTGVLCGPSCIGVVQDAHAVDTLSEIGVAFLLFGIGLELSGDALNRLKKPVFIGGTLQLTLTIAAVAGFFLFMGRHLSTALIGGCLITLSSSAIVLRLLQEKGSTETPMGRLSLAILVFQDIMAVPILLLIPLMAGQASLDYRSMMGALGKIVLVGGGVYLFARYGLDRLMQAVVRTRISELVQLTTIGLCMGMALLSDWLGLSLSLGAFIAGLLLARSEYSMSVLSGIMPYRDVFMSIFFISVGMLVDVSHVAEHFVPIIGLTALFIAMKAVLTMPAVLVQNYPLRTAITVSLSLAQIGEFSFVLADAALKANVFTNMSYYQDFLSMSILTMLATPFLMNLSPKLADAVDRWRGKDIVEAREDDSSHANQLRNHLIIIGFGISGKYLAGAAKQTGLPYEILEMNPDTVARYRDQEPIYHGDAKQPAVLDHLGVKTATVLTIVISDPAAVRAITAEARKMNPSLHIVARTRYLGEVEALQKLGADNVVAEEFESAIEVFSRVLGHFLVPRAEIDAMSAQIRKENYEMSRTASDRAAPLGALVEQLPDVGVNAFKIEPGSELIGQNLVDAALRKRFNVNIVALKRAKEMMAPPDARIVFEANDVVYAFGSTEDLRRLGEIFLERQEHENPEDRHISEAYARR